MCRMTHPLRVWQNTHLESSMAKRFYPAVLEKGAKGTFGAWFPDFADCVAAGRSQEEAIQKAELELARRCRTRCSNGRRRCPSRPRSRPSSFRRAAASSRSSPSASSRRTRRSASTSICRSDCSIAADETAAEYGMSRSSFFGLAISSMVGLSFGGYGAPLLRPRAAKAAEPGGEKTRTKRSGR